MAQMIQVSLSASKELRQDLSIFSGEQWSIFTCVALAKAGLVVGPLRPSGRLSETL